MRIPSEDVRDMLEAESSLNLVFATNLFIGKEPAKPNNTVTIFDTYSRQARLTFDNAKYEYPSVQLRIRNLDYDEGLNLAYSICTLLHGRAHETWGESTYEVIIVANGPIHLDWDENSRARFIINLNLQRH